MPLRMRWEFRGGGGGRGRRRGRGPQVWVLKGCASSAPSVGGTPCQPGAAPAEGTRARRAQQVELAPNPANEKEWHEAVGACTSCSRRKPHTLASLSTYFAVGRAKKLDEHAASCSSRGRRTSECSTHARSSYANNTIRGIGTTSLQQSKPWTESGTAKPSAKALGEALRLPAQESFLPSTPQQSLVSKGSEISFRLLFQRHSPMPVRGAFPGAAFQECKNGAELCERWSGGRSARCPDTPCRWRRSRPVPDSGLL